MIECITQVDMLDEWSTQCITCAQTNSIFKDPAWKNKIRY